MALNCYFYQTKTYKEDTETLEEKEIFILKNFIPFDINVTPLLTFYSPGHKKKEKRGGTEVGDVSLCKLVKQHMLSGVRDGRTGQLATVILLMLLMKGILLGGVGQHYRTLQPAPPTYSPSNLHSGQLTQGLLVAQVLTLAKDLRKEEG